MFLFVGGGGSVLSGALSFQSLTFEWLGLSPAERCGVVFAQIGEKALGQLFGIPPGLPFGVPFKPTRKVRRSSVTLLGVQPPLRKPQAA